MRGDSRGICTGVSVPVSLGKFRSITILPLFLPYERKLGILIRDKAETAST